MKNLKLGILACGGVLLVLLLFEDYVATLKEDPLNTILVTIGCAVPLLLGLLGLVRPPFEQWQGVAALAAFGLVAVKYQLWQELPEIMKAELDAKIAMAALVIGIVLSALSIAKPEERRS